MDSLLYFMTTGSSLLFITNWGGGGGVIHGHVQEQSLSISE